MEWTKIFALIGAVLIVFFLFRGIRARSDLFSKAALGKSFHTMGFLALILIAFIGVCILLLKSSA